MQVENRFESEKSRTHHYLHSQTGPPLRKILEESLLTQNLATIIHMPNSGLDPMIDLDKLEDLSRLYRLFIMVPSGLPTLKRALKDSVVNRGKDVNQASLAVEVNEVDMETGKAETDVAKGSATTKARNGANQPQTLALALKWVQDVLQLKDKFDLFWKEAFSGDREVESALNEVTGSVFNLFMVTYSILLGFRGFHQFE